MQKVNLHLQNPAFDGLEQLKQQIFNDIDVARALLAC